MENIQKKWYQKTGWIIALSILFFPLGLYLLWKNKYMSKPLKWTIFAGWLAFFGYAASQTDFSNIERGSTHSGKMCCCRFKDNSVLRTDDNTYITEWTDESTCRTIGGEIQSKEKGECY